MSDLVHQLASDSGLDPDQAKVGLGAILGMLKHRLDPQAFSKLSGAIPDAGNMVSAFESKLPAGAGGIVETVKNLAGKLFGGGHDATAALQSHLGGLGVNADQLKNLVTKLYDLLANKLPPELLEQIKRYLPGFGPAATHKV
jgi:Protein of unknown function VcgC/VcgE (DUF2780)